MAGEARLRGRRPAQEAHMRPGAKGRGAAATTRRHFPRTNEAGRPAFPS